MSETSEISEISEISETSDARDAPAASDVREENVLRVRLGHGANCSSVGSVVDTLFLGATLGGVVFAAVCAAMKVERVTVVGASYERERAPSARGAAEASKRAAADAADADEDEDEDEDDDAADTDEGAR